MLPVKEVFGELTRGMIAEDKKGLMNRRVKIGSSMNVLFKSASITGGKVDSRGEMVRDEYDLILVVVCI